MINHVNNITRNSYVQIRNIARIRKYLTDEAAATLINSLVTSRIDNMNSLLAGLPKCTTDKLQKIQNHAAKITARKKKQDHVQPILFHLHWLPLAYRIKYKIALLTFKCLKDLAPHHLKDKLLIYVPSRLLRSEELLLVQPKSNQKHFGDHAFSIIAHRIWNSLLTFRFKEL